MKAGDRVKHKKYGVGTVFRTYRSGGGVRVRYDDGKETVNGESRLTVVADNFTEAAPPPAPTQPARISRGRSAGTTDVDYDKLARAKAYFEGLHPKAVVAPKVYGSRVYCEIWVDGAADIVFYEERA